MPEPVRPDADTTLSSSEADVSVLSLPQVESCPIVPNNGSLFLEDTLQPLYELLPPETQQDATLSMPNFRLAVTALPRGAP